jgi:putative ABC transport system permease protein
MFFRSLYEGIKIAWISIRANKVRASLTTFGIVIGIVSVTTMATVIDGVNRSFESSLNMIGQNVLFIQKWPWNFGPNFNWWDYINRPEMQVAYADQLQELSRSAEAVAAMMFRSDNVRYEDRLVQRADIMGVTPSYVHVGSVDLDSGRFFTDEENRAGRNVAVIGSGIASALFDEADPVHRTIRLAGQRFEIIGVMEEQGKFLGMEDFDNQIIIPVQTFGRNYGFRRFVQIRVKFPDEASLIEGEYEIEGLMRRIRRLEPGQDNDFSINKMEMFRQQYRAMTGAIYGIGIFLTGLALFVGGIGVMNIMFVSVKERTKEVGIRKAIGAKSHEILFQFLVEAVFICIIGGLIGVLLSLGTAAIINSFFVAYLDWGTVLAAFVICTLTGLIFGFLPAWKAAKADPIESLRYE